VLLPRRLSIAFERERLELEDDDFLDLGWARLGGDKLAILSHGFEGCSDDGYNRGMATALHAAGWDALAWNLRGCGKEMNCEPWSERHVVEFLAAVRTCGLEFVA
jgi:predicted alpha/beta-fold hydrolase